MGTTATGSTPAAGRTVAVDPQIIPLGSEIMIDGQEYTAEDTGGAIKQYKIDVFVSSHDEAIKKGVQTHTVYIKE